MKRENLRKAFEKPLPQLMFQKHYLITYRILFTTALSIGIIGGIGYLIDRIFQIKPVFTIIGLVIALPASIVIVISQIKDLAEKTVANHENDSTT